MDFGDGEEESVPGALELVRKLATEKLISLRAYRPVTVLTEVMVEQEYHVGRPATPTFWSKDRSSPSFGSNQRRLPKYKEPATLSRLRKREVRKGLRAVTALLEHTLSGSKVGF